MFALPHGTRLLRENHDSSGGPNRQGSCGCRRRAPWKSSRPARFRPRPVRRVCRPIWAASSAGTSSRRRIRWGLSGTLPRESKAYSGRKQHKLESITHGNNPWVFATGASKQPASGKFITPQAWRVNESTTIAGRSDRITAHRIAKMAFPSPRRGRTGRPPQLGIDKRRQPADSISSPPRCCRDTEPKGIAYHRREGSTRGRP